MTKRQTQKTSITHFEGQPLSAEFTEGNGHIVTSALILVEGDHVDSKQRKHNFPAERVERIANNTNLLLQQGARLPLLTDHQKTQDTTIGDVESSIETRVITADDITDPKYNHLIGKFGAFANQVTIKSRKAIEQYKDKLLSTISPGIDIVSDTIRELSCTSTPAIVGLRLFKGGDSNLADFALSFDELENSDDQVDQVRQQYTELTEDLWLVLSSILTASDEALNGQDQSQLIEQALDDFETRLLEVLAIEPEDGEDPNAQPTTPQQEDVKAQQTAGMPRTLSQRGGAQYNASESNQVLAAFTLDEMEKLAEFGLGSSIMKRATGVATRLGREKASIKAQGGLGKAIASGLGRTSGAAKSGFASAKKASVAGGGGRLKSNLAGAMGGTKAALKTRGGKIAAGLGGTAAVGVGAVGVSRLRKPKQPKF